MKLTNENIDISAAQVFKAIFDYTGDRGTAIKTRLMAEEILSGYQSQFGEETEYSIKDYTRLRRCHLIISVDGVRFYPLEENAQDEVLNSMMAAFGETPFWAYQGGENTITWIFKKRRKYSQIVSLALSIGLAFLAAFLFSLLPLGAQTVIATKIVSPLLNAFMNIVRCIAGPMVFLSIVWGIYCMGDVSLVKMIGKKMIGRFLLFSAGLTLVSMLVVLPFFTITNGGTESMDLSTLYQMILDIIPDNIVTPFADGNTLQIIYLAVCFGLAGLILGKRSHIVTQAIEQLNYIIQLLMDVISGMINMFVFLSIFDLIVGGSLVKLSNVLKIIPTMLIGVAVPMLVYLIRVSISRHVSIIKLIKKQLQTFLIAIATASSAAAFSTNIDCCTDELGIDKKIVNLGVPLGQVVFAIGTMVSFICIGLCMADTFGIAISPKWLTMMFIMSFVLGIATPPIPGGSIACFTIFAGQLGLPDAAISMCIAISIITDFISTAVNLFCLQLELVQFSNKVGLLEEDVLKR